MNQLPNFFIVGAAKAGTTSLWQYLSQHPDIYMPESIVDKEPSYFCKIYGQKEHFQYQQLFREAGEHRAIGEASTVYLTSPESASWIRNEIPKAKIIIVLRNPVDRSYSLYRWMVNHGYEWADTFERALDIELSRKSDAHFYMHNPQYFYIYMYFESGLYSEQIARYVKEFSADNLKIILMDDLKINPIEAVQDVYRFLCVDSSFVPTIKVHNRAEFQPLSVRLHFRLRKIERRFGRRIIGKIARALFDMNIKFYKRSWPAMNPATRRSLMERYKIDIVATQALIGRDLSAWM
jgi:hypothetical protein